MKALQFRKSVPRYLLSYVTGPRSRLVPLHFALPIALREIPAPRLPNGDWVRVAPRLAGICGSDVAAVSAKSSPYLGAVTSMPFVLGHEVVGVVVECGSGVRRVREGDRVVLRPALGCKVRGIDPPCIRCAEGRDALCQYIAHGDISAGIQTGYCRDTGGGFGECFVAHESQLFAVPTTLSDRQAVLIEPFACALHATLMISPSEDDTILVIGCGTIGLLVIAALRAVGCKSRIAAAARYDYQGELARDFGADILLNGSRSDKIRTRTWAETLGAELHRADLGGPLAIGGSRVTFDCIGSSASIMDGLRFTGEGGTFVLVGMPGVPRGVDWTPMWHKELQVRAAYAYGRESANNGSEDTFDVALRLIPSLAAKFEKLLGEPFDLKHYCEAFATAMSPGRNRSIKAVFAINQ